MAARTPGAGYADVRPLTERFVETLRTQMGGDLLGVALYGSVARGEARADSDVDLLIVHRGSRSAAFDAAIASERALEEEELSERLRESGVPTRFSFVVFSEPRFADTPWLLLDISHHGIKLFDPYQVVSRKLAAQETVQNEAQDDGALQDTPPAGAPAPNEPAREAPSTTAEPSPPPATEAGKTREPVDTGRHPG